MSPAGSVGSLAMTAWKPRVHVDAVVGIADGGVQLGQVGLRLVQSIGGQS